MAGDRESVTEPVSTGASREASRFTAIQPGVLFADRYRIEGRIGSGGTGEVFRAFDEIAASTVALKVLYPGSEAQDVALARLRREVSILRELRHPGIVRLFDVGKSQGLLFLVMELLEGESLRQRLSRQTVIPFAEALRLFMSAMDALAAAHGAGVIHRDIKPANIFLRPLDSGGPEHEQAVLLDFGLARRSQDETVTMSGQFLGTPDYVAPEQLLAKKDIGPPADVYASAMLLCEMLTGDTPFAGADSISRRLKGDLPRLRTMLPDAPGWLIRLLRWMFLQAPERRPAHAGLVLNSLHTRSIPWRSRLQTFASSLGTAPAILMAGGLSLAFIAGFVLIPVRVASEGEITSARSALGVPVREFSPPIRLVSDPVPFHPDAIWKRKWLGLESDPYGPDPEPEAGHARVGLVEFDLLDGTSVPFHPERTSAWIKPSSQRFDTHYVGRALLSLPWIDKARGQLFLSIHNHSKHFPTHMNVFSLSAEPLFDLEHQGRLDSQLAVIRPDLLVMPGKNDALGRISILMGIRFDPDGLRRSAQAVTPPYEGMSATSTDVLFYTFLPGLEVTGMRDHGDELVVQTSDGAIPIAPDTGIPLTVENRSGLSREAYASSQRAVLDAMQDAAMLGIDPTDAALRLQGMLSTATLTPAQVAVARYQEAVYWTRAGESLAALGALSAIPDEVRAFPGFFRLRLFNQVARGLWEEAETDGLGVPRKGSSLELDRDLVVGALLSGDLQQAGSLTSRITSPHHAVVAGTLLALHAGNQGEALGILEADPVRLQEPFIAYLHAVSLFLGRSLELDRLQSSLTLAVKGRGGGFRIPAASLSLLLKDQQEETQQISARERLEHLKASRRTYENIVDLYLSYWEQAFVARACREQGDQDCFTQLRDDLIARPVAGPWLDSLLASSPGPTE